HDLAGPFEAERGAHHAVPERRLRGGEVGAVQPAGLHAGQHLVRLRLGLRDIAQLEPIRRRDSGFHRLCSISTYSGTPALRRPSSRTSLLVNRSLIAAPSTLSRSGGPMRSRIAMKSRASLISPRWPQQLISVL